MRIHGNAAAVVADADALVGVQRHRDFRAEAAQRLVDRIVNHLVHAFIVFIANNEALSAGVRTTGELVRRYVVKNKGKETYLYRDGERWFVEMKA